MNVYAVITKIASKNILIRRCIVHFLIWTENNRERIADVRHAKDVSANIQAQRNFKPWTLRTIMTGCGCLLKHTLHSKVLTVLYICSGAHCTDGHRLTKVCHHL